MDKYKCLKIIYNQHLSIKGWGLSVNAPANALISLNDNVKKDSEKDSLLKVFYNRVLFSSTESLAKTQVDYNEFKKSIKVASRSSEKVKLINELNKRRREFAKKIDNACDAIIDKASRFQGEATGIFGEIEKHKIEPYKINLEMLLKSKNLRAKKSRFFKDECEIRNVDNLTNEALKERLKSMMQLFDEFLRGNINVLKKIKNDLKFIINRTIKVEELDEEVFGDFVISAPTVVQGIKLDKEGKVIK